MCRATATAAKKPETSTRTAPRAAAARRRATLIRQLRVGGLGAKRSKRSRSISRGCGSALNPASARRRRTARTSSTRRASRRRRVVFGKFAPERWSRSSLRRSEIGPSRLLAAKCASHSAGHVPSLASRVETNPSSGARCARACKRGGGVEVLAGRQKEKASPAASTERRSFREPRPRLVEHRLRADDAGATRGQPADSVPTRYRSEPSGTRRPSPARRRRPRRTRRRRRRARERGDGRRDQAASTDGTSIPSCSCSSGGSPFVGIRVTALCPRAREEHQRAASVRPSRSARVAQPKTNRRVDRNASASSTSTRFAPGRSARSCFATRLVATRPARRMNTRRSVGCETAPEARRGAPGQPGTPNAFLPFAPPRLEYRRRRREPRERNRLNETDAPAASRPGLAVARIRVVLEHAEVAQRQDHASGRESAVGRRVPTERRAREDTVARRLIRRDENIIAIRDIFASRATRCVFPAVAPARSRERALLPRERSVREWQDALAGAGACGGEEGTGRDACVRVSVADAEHAASREVVARGERSKRGAAGNTHVLPARIVSCVVRDIPDASRSLGANRDLLWRRDWTRCRGQSIGTQLFSSRAHGAMSSLHFSACADRKSASRTSEKQTFFPSCAKFGQIA